jgi:metal-responsive CopG/Arc/MetJ family transcriptional regulator
MYTLYIMHTLQTQALSRTQIYLTGAQQQALGLLSERHAQSKSELIRCAIDKFIAEQQQLQSSTKLQRLMALSGAWNEDSFTGDIRAMRAEWSNRQSSEVSVQQ